jgi:hypothetical protein
MRIARNLGRRFQQWWLKMAAKMGVPQDLSKERTMGAARNLSKRGQTISNRERAFFL